jgi:ATP-dependent DNA helicase RecG
MDITKFIDTIKKGENEQVEFKANIQKEIANDICAFLNTDGGNILIGVSDDGDVNGIDDFNSSKQKLADIINSINPHPEVNTSCLDLSFMQKQGKCILIIEVAKGDKLYSYKNRVNIRVGRNNRTLTIQELIEKASESILILFDEQTSKYNSEVISKKLFEDYLNKRLEKRGIEKSGTIEENLRQLKITKGVKATNGGILCFSNNPQNYIPYARIRLVKFENENTKSYSDMREFTGPISKIMTDIEKYFLSILFL